MPEMSVTDNDKFVVEPQRSDLPSTPVTPRSRSASPSPDSALTPDPAVADASRLSRRVAAGDPAFPFVESDNENELPPSYEISTLPRPSDAHVHVTVRSNESASSLPSIMAGRAGGRGSINTQGYLLTAPMSHQSATTTRPSADWTWNHADPHHHHHHARARDRDSVPFWGVEDPWVRHMYNADAPYEQTCCLFRSCAGDDGCCYSNRGGCCFSDRGGCCFSDRGGFCFGDREGACCSDNGGFLCSNQAGCCCWNGEDDTLPVMRNNSRSA